MMIPDARILTTARKFSGDLGKRWRSLKGDINTYIVEDDRLNLKDPQPGDVMTDGAGFNFSDGTSKEEQFMNWYNERVRSGVLEPVGDRQLKRGGHFTAKYVRSARDGGVRDAGTRLREAGGTPNFSRSEISSFFDLPVATDQIATLYRREFTELQGITEAVGQQVSRELSDGVAAGENPRKIARRINDRVDNVGITRSRTLARTELARSYNHGSLLRYERNNIEQVNILNTNPCPEICAPLIADNPYPVKEAYGLVPGQTHPVCMCTVSPVVPGVN